MTLDFGLWRRFSSRVGEQMNRPTFVLGTLLVIAACGETGTTEQVPTFAVGSTSTMVALPTEIKADGVSQSTITVTLKDPDGIPMFRGGDFVDLSSSRGALSALVDNGNGTYTAKLTSETTTGTAVVTGSVNGSRITTGGGEVRIAFLP